MTAVDDYVDLEGPDLPRRDEADKNPPPVAATEMKLLGSPRHSLEEVGCF